MNRVSNQLRSIERWLLWTAFLSLDLIILGAIVRATDSGLACPDWPMCYGQLVPEMNMQIFIEWFHRAVALVLGVLLAVVGWKILRPVGIRKKFASQLYALIVLFLVQCVLGGLTVLELLDPKIVSFHLINSLLFLGVMLWLTLSVRYERKGETYRHRRQADPVSRWMLYTLVATLLAQIFLGGMVATNHAGLACPDIPKCYDAWIPPYSFPIYLQFTHRVSGVVVLILSALLLLKRARPKSQPFMTAAKRFVFPLVGFQVLLGIGMIKLFLPIWMSVIHQNNAIIIYTLAVLAAIDASLGPRFSSMGQLKESENNMTSTQEVLT